LTKTGNRRFFKFWTEAPCCCRNALERRNVRDRALQQRQGAQSTHDRALPFRDRAYCNDRADPKRPVVAAMRGSATAHCDNDRVPRKRAVAHFSCVIGIRRLISNFDKTGIRR